MVRKILFVFSLISSPVRPVWAAACCGPSAGLPSMLTSGERWKLQGGFTQTTTIADVGANGEPVFRREGQRRSTPLMNIDVVGELTESWQAGASLARSPKDGRVGDLSLQLLHELWPETDTPRGLLRGFVFTQVILPTGRALEEIRQPEEDPTGEGRGSAAVGAVGIRRGWSDDQFVSLRVRSFAARGFDGGTSISSSWKVDSSLGAGQTWGPWRGGLALKAEYETPRQVSVSNTVTVASENYRFPVSFSGSYFFKGGAMAQLQYTDDTLLGPVKNILLGRSVGVIFAQRFY